MTDIKKNDTAKSDSPEGAVPSAAESATARPTKKQLLIDRLSTATGADLATLTWATGWQPHTVRAALSRLKAEGHAVIRAPGADGTAAYYRIAATPPEANEPQTPGQTQTEERGDATVRKKPARRKPAREAAATSAVRGKADAGDAA